MPVQFADANPLPIPLPAANPGPVPVAAAPPQPDLADHPVVVLAPAPAPSAAAPQPDLAADPVLAPAPALAPVLAAAAMQPHLPLARQPFNRNWPVHNLGEMNIPCSDCGALHWLAERLASSSMIHPKFGTCCFSGKVHLPRLHDPPPEPLELLRGQDPISKDFRSNIRSYNNALAMTSLGC